MNLIDEKAGNVFKLIGTEEGFLNRIPLAPAIRSTINSCDLMKLSFCMAKDTIIWTKQQPTELEKIFLPTIDSIEHYYSKYIKNSKT